MLWLIENNKSNFAVLLFLFSLTLIHLAKPPILYNENGSFRDFGVGYRHKTVFPIWVVAILLALISYMFVCWLARQDFT